LGKYWFSVAANVDATRKSLGIPTDSTGVELAILSEVDHVFDARIDIVFRRGGQDLTPRIPLALDRAENAWYVTGAVRPASPEQKRAIDGVAAEFLASLAEGLSAHPVSPSGRDIDIATHRASTFGPFAKTTLSDFKVRSITDETVSSIGSWFADASVTAVQGGRPVAFSVQLTGPTAQEIAPVSVTDGKFVR
jgi:hypothetical protein